MIEVEIPQDIREYEPKLLAGLTTRNVFSLIFGGGCAAIVYQVGIRFLPSDIIGFISILVAAPFVLCGFVKIYGLRFDQFVKVAFIPVFLSPQKRKYKTENAFLPYIRTESKIKKKDQKKYLKKTRNNKNRNMRAFI